MAVLSVRQIYRACRTAGFSPDQATTMTAVALAESGGSTDAHNTSGEDSVGIFQINRQAHGWASAWDLTDPVTSARAAYRISGRGETIAPWTTTHGGPDARYLAYRKAAEAAAREEGDGTGLGVWSGTDGYGDDVPAGDAGGDARAPTSYTDDVEATAATGSPTAGDTDVQAFLTAALSQTGDDYVYGHEVGLDDADPETFDCSELVQWASHQAGVEMPDGSWYQYLSLEQQGDAIPVERAIDTPGALLFSFSSRPEAGGGRPEQAHVAISLGNGRTIEARGSSYGVGSWEASTERFNYAAVIPGLADGATGTTLAAQLDAALTPASPGASDDDHDRDGMTDHYETVVAHTDPWSADTDHDTMPDSVELLLGEDPLIEPSVGDTEPL